VEITFGRVHERDSSSESDGDCYPKPPTPFKSAIDSIHLINVPTNKRRRITVPRYSESEISSPANSYDDELLDELRANEEINLEDSEKPSIEAMSTTISWKTPLKTDTAGSRRIYIR
jgi:hypothetical protein